MPYYVSKERVERDGVLVYAEGDEIPATDVDELERQGYEVEDGVAAPNLSTERVVRDDVLIYAEGDEIPDEDLDELERQGLDVDAAKHRLEARGLASPGAPSKRAKVEVWAEYRAGQGHAVEGLTKDQLIELPDTPQEG